MPEPARSSPTAARLWLVVAALMGALAVGLGAYGAHALPRMFEPAQVSTWVTGARYQLVHSVALLALALAAPTLARSIVLPAALWSVGMLLFSGSIYILVWTGVRQFGPVTPIGGLLLVAGWLALLPLARRRPDGDADGDGEQGARS